MAVRSSFAGKSFDPETIKILSKAFQGACHDLGVSGRTRHARTTVAQKVLELGDGQHDPEAIRAAVVTALKAQY